MAQRAVALCFLLGLCQVALAEEAVLPHPVESKRQAFQLNDIITVKVDYRKAPCITADAKVNDKTCSDCLHLHWGKPEGINFEMATSVVNIRPNGDLEIEGRSEEEKDGAICETTLTGIVRPDRIGPERTISGDDIAERRIRIRVKNASHDVLPAQYEPRPVSIQPQPSPVPQNVELEQKLQELAQLQSDIRQLRAETGRGEQIQIHVNMLEVSLTKLSRLQVELKDSKKTSLNVKDTCDFSEMATKLLSNPNGIDQQQTNSDRYPAFIEWLQQNNIAKSLADPTVVTMDGRAASLHVGGEIPVPADQSNSVEFKKFGTELDILPVTLGNNRVRIEVRARISEIDNSKTFEVNGQQVPALSVRQCDTAVESSFGRSCVLTGLVERRIETQKRGDKTEDLVNHVALMLIVTPELVDSASEIKQASHIDAEKCRDSKAPTR